MFLKKFVPKLHKALGVYLPLITTNCAVLGVSLTNVQDGNNFITSVLTGFGTACGFALAIIILAGIREKTENNDFPQAFKGTHSVLLTACLMAIAFYGFSSLKKGGAIVSLHNILIATGIVAAVGLIIAIVLSIAEKAFHVDVDEKEVAVRECLAGNNCGACGYEGCDALAKEIAQGEAPENEHKKKKKKNKQKKT